MNITNGTLHNLKTLHVSLKLRDTLKNNVTRGIDVPLIFPHSKSDSENMHAHALPLGFVG